MTYRLCSVMHHNEGASALRKGYTPLLHAQGRHRPYYAPTSTTRKCLPPRHAGTKVQAAAATDGGCCSYSNLALPVTRPPPEHLQYPQQYWAPCTTTVSAAHTAQLPGGSPFCYSSSGCATWKGLSICSVPAVGATTVTAVPRHTCSNTRQQHTTLVQRMLRCLAVDQRPLGLAACQHSTTCCPLTPHNNATIGSCITRHGKGLPCRRALQAKQLLRIQEASVCPQPHACTWLAAGGSSCLELHS